MERLCPECLGTLEIQDSGTARCTVHGGDYKILFLRETGLPPVVVPAGPPATGTACANHPNVPAVFTCAQCGTAICSLCAFAQADGSQKCATCATAPAGPAPVRAAVPATAPAVQGQKCKQHPNVEAVQICHTCGAPMCATCDFALPGNYHVCPTCATAQPKLSPKRKKMLVSSFVLAVWCTFVTALLFGGAFRAMARDKDAQQAVGLLLILVLVIPAIVGLALGISSLDRRLSNTIAMWLAIIWNGIILGIFLLLMIIGLMKG